MTWSVDAKGVAKPQVQGMLWMAGAEDFCVGKREEDRQERKEQGGEPW